MEYLSNKIYKKNCSKIKIMQYVNKFSVFVRFFNLAPLFKAYYEQIFA